MNPSLPDFGLGAAPLDAEALALLARGGALLDQWTAPPLRRVLGSLLASARQADFALARIRLAALDLTARELSALERCRVLLGRLDVDTLEDAATAAERAAETRARLAALRQALRGGRIEVRAAGVEAWLPDFSVVRPHAGAPVVLVGAHYFDRPPPPDGGPALTCVVSGEEVGERVGRRFEVLWERGYDVLPVVRELLERRLGPDG